MDSRPPPDAKEDEARWKELAAAEGRMLAKLSDVRTAVHEELDEFRRDFSTFKDDVRVFMQKSLERDLDANQRIADVSTAVVAEKAPEMRRSAMTGGALSATVISGIVAGVLIWLSQTNGCAPTKGEHDGHAEQAQHREAHP